jgi:hypothetical protein
MAALETEYAIRKVLVDNAAVSALVSTRIYPMFNVPSNAKLPYITFRRNAGQHVHHMQGASGRVFAQVDVYCFALTDSLMRDLGTKVRKALDGYNGAVTVGSDSVTIDLCFLENETDDIAAPQDGSNSPIFIRLLEYKVSNRTETS